MSNIHEKFPQVEQPQAGTKDRLEANKVVSYNISDNSQAALAERETDEAQALQGLQGIKGMPDRTSTGMNIEAEEINELLLATEAINAQLDKEVTERFGEGFYESVRTRMNSWVESFLKTGDDAVGWVEAKGLPLPKSKAGMRMLSGVVGVAGIAPGMGVLWPLAYVLWKRGGSRGNITSSNAESAIKYV